MDYLRDPAAIYRRSFEILRAETDFSPLPPDAEPIATRIIHACGMPEIAADLRISEDFVTVATAALTAGKPVLVDAETTALIDFAKSSFQGSQGAFDITCGVLRRVWHFDGSERVPSMAAIKPLLELIGFDKLTWQSPWLTVPEGMEIDLGGIGKEFAVDRALALVTAQRKEAVLVNFGGDLACRGVPRSGAWQVGIEQPLEPLQAALLLELKSGALATSGDTHRYLMHQGRRLGHILDPRTGWPVEGGPASVTVAAGSCTEAGTLATLALLQGAGAGAFLRGQGVQFWCQLPA
jgi:thiamine biosynthesis lipoprotein